MFSRRSLFSLFWLFLCSALSMGQGTSGTISGRVTDPQGAVLSGATVVFQNLDVGIARQVSTDSQGYYRVAGLPPGRYKVQAERSEFNLEKQTVITLTVAQESVVDLILGINPVSEELTIKGETGTIDRSSSTISGLVDEK